MAALVWIAGMNGGSFSSSDSADWLSTDIARPDWRLEPANELLPLTRAASAKDLTTAEALSEKLLDRLLSSCISPWEDRDDLNDFWLF